MTVTHAPVSTIYRRWTPVLTEVAKASYNRHVCFFYISYGAHCSWYRPQNLVTWIYSYRIDPCIAKRHPYIYVCSQSQ